MPVIATVVDALSANGRDFGDEAIDEFNIERNVGGWLKIREEACKRRKVCFAMEINRAFYSSSDGNKDYHYLRAPIHREGDFADVLIIRHDIYDAPRQRMAYAEWRKSGKHIVMAPKTYDKSWSSWYEPKAREALTADANPGLYSWNELNRIDYIVSIIHSISASTNMIRFFDWMGKKESSLLNNGDFENGAGRFIPEWEAISSHSVIRTTDRAYSGIASLRIQGTGRKVIVSSASTNFDSSKTYGVLFWAQLESKNKNDNYPTVTVRLATQSTNHYIESSAQWTAMPSIFNNISGIHELEIEVTPPVGVTLYFDNIRLIELP